MLNDTIQPLVSVVVPVFNVEKYLQRSIESVLEQSYRKFELIIVDDGSTDDSFSIYHKFADIDSRIKVVWQANQGLAAARNTGIRIASGEYVALLDSDDYWHVDKLKYHVKLLQTFPQVGVSYSSSSLIDEEGQEIGLIQNPKCHHIRPKDVFLRNPIGNGSAAVIRKVVFDEIAFEKESTDAHVKTQYFNESLRQSEDIECWVKIATKTNWDFMGIKRPLTYYRINDGGLSANTKKQFQSWLSACNLMKEYAPNFVRQHYSLAEAFQYRYLARRAVRSKDRGKAINLMLKAFRSNPKIIFMEPVRTVITLAGSLSLLLPRKYYKVIENSVMNLLLLRRKIFIPLFH